MANIEDINEAWAGHSGLEVETFLKGQLGSLSAALGGKFGYVTFNPNTMSLVFYDQQGGTPLGDIQLGGDIITIDLHANLSQVFYVLADEATKVLSLTPTTSKSQFGSSSSEDVPELYSYSISVDSGSGYTPKASGETRQVGETISVDLKPFLATGDNYIRVSVTGLTTGKTQTTVFTGTKTSLFLSCSHAWQAPWMEGESYVINGIRFAGSLVKYLHVSVKKGTTEVELDPVEYAANVSYTNTSTTFTIPASAFPITGETSGNCIVNLWMTAQGVSTPVISFDIMCVKTGDTTPLVAVNSVTATAYNFTSGRLFSFAVYNADKAEFSLSASLGGTTYPIVQNVPETGLSPNIQYPFSFSLEVDTGANNTQTGSMAISARAYDGTTGGPTVTASTIFDNSYSFLAAPGYLFYLNAATRSNNSEDYDLIVNDGTPDAYFASSYQGVWTGFSFSDDAWAVDDLGYKALVVPAGAELSVTGFCPLKDFSAYSAGMTVEMMLKMGMPADYDTPALTIGSASAGVLIYPTKIVVYGSMEQNEVNQSVIFAENTMTHIVITFIKDYGEVNGRNLCSIYINGTSNVNFPFDGLSSFGDASSNLVIGQANTDVYLYKMRVYGTPLESSAVLSNFLNCIVDGVEFTRSNVVAKNNVQDNGQASYELVKQAGYNTMVITLPSDDIHIPDEEHQAKDKDNTAISNAKVEFEYAGAPTKNATISKTKLDGQGTTSMKYYRWNLRFKTSDKAGKETTWEYGDGTSETPGKKGRMINDPAYVKVDRITAKKNYASSMQGHKMGLTGLYNDIFHASPLNLGSHLPNPTYLVAVYQFPFVGFRKYSNGDYEYIGLYTAGPDKSSKTSFGHSTSTYENLMSIEGPNHEPRGTRFVQPWVDVYYDPSEETLCMGGNDGKNYDAWDCAIAGDNATDLEGDQTDWDNILALFGSEWRPAYDCVFNNSPYIAKWSDALTESGFASIEAINASQSTIDAFQAMTTGGIKNEVLTFYDDNYDIWFYRKLETKYRKLSDISSDPALVYNLLTDLASMLSDYCTDPTHPTTAEIVAMRVARFRATAGNYFDMDQVLYHYCYCILFGVTDNFAKNMYPFKFRGFNETLVAGESVYCKRWGFRQDDLDTVLATDNNGRNTKSYSVEHGDVNSSGNQIFNGGDSALWVLIRDYYGAEQETMMGKIVQAIATIANNLGITGAKLHETVFNVVSYYCWDKSSKYFSQTLYEDDRYWSYITPWLENAAKQYNNVYPWEQALGDQLQSEKMWVQRRIVYIFSKYKLGAFTGTNTDYNGLAITLAASFTFQVKPAIDLYPVGSTGDANSQGPRTFASGQPTSLPVAVGTGNTTNYIHALDWIASLGDLSNMILTDRQGDTNIVLAVVSDRLRELKVGDANPSVVVSPAVYYTQLEVNAYNAELDGAIAGGATLTAEQAGLVNTALSTSYAEGDTISTADANAYNATLTGAISTSDVKIPEVRRVPFNATGLSVESPSITTIDARNTRTLSGSLNLFNCPRLRVCLFAGSGINGLLLPVGALLTDVSFPEACSVIFLHSLPMLTNARLILPPLGGIISLYINNCDQLNPFTIASAILSTIGNALEYATIIWRGVVQGDVDTVLGLSEISGRVVYENGTTRNVAGTADIEGTVQVPGVYSDYEETLDIVSEEPYQTNLKKALSNLFETPLYIIYDPANVWVKFVDDAFKAICLANWDSNSDGKFSVQEAAEVSSTDFSTVGLNSLHNNANIVSLYDLRYFTNVTTFNKTGGSSSSTYGPIYGMSNLTTIAFAGNMSIPSYNLKRCPKLRTWYLGGTLTASAAQIFADNPGLFGQVYLKNMEHWYGSAIRADAYTSFSVACHLYLNDVEVTTIDFPSTRTSVRNYCFGRCTSITSITLPSSITSIGTGAFYYCSGLTTLVVKATTPPTLSNTNALTGTNANLKIYVPYSADHSILNAYKAATNWSSYASKMYELDEDGNIPT